MLSPNCYPPTARKRRADCKTGLNCLYSSQPSECQSTLPHIQRLIDSGELSTAEELIYYCEVGEPVPHATVREDLTQFFPTVPDALPGGITAEVIEAALTGSIVPGCDVLDFGGLSEDARTAVADALNVWRQLGLTPVEGRNGISERAQLLPALRVAGFEFDAQTRVNQLSNVQKGRERRFVEMSNMSWNGKPLVPQFGSKLGGRLRVLLCWGRPAEDLLMSWTDQDTSADAILVTYFGTMSAAGTTPSSLPGLRAPTRPSSSSTTLRWPTWPRTATGSLTQRCRSCCRSPRYSRTCGTSAH